jgi:BirA family biotin operon repressor/biotin-[acetyl-CoA-carboxylase] ligase
VKIIKLNAIDSTNTYLKELGKNVSLSDATVVWAKNQTGGRGQMGANWQSKIGQSLTFSVLKRFKQLDIQEHSKITYAVTLGIKNALQDLGIPGLSVKWPNDIMSYNQKLCGVLIENQLEGQKLISAVVGIGLNVNETLFLNLPQATSMRLTTGREFNLEEVFNTVITEVMQQLNDFANHNLPNLKEKYEEILFRIEKVSSFERPDGSRFNGIIKGVTATGELLVEDQNQLLTAFELKQIKMLF